ncbi:hypothetical protein GX48_01799 [Paracoccidioides brasiliensis]|nr:hypothetical protein GX48_01799 [Paracoccidioides brasiliensis]
MFRRKRASAHAPINSNPSPSAQTAAVQAFRASQANANISTAAAATALRRHTPTPTSVENVQTKRMLERQLSTGSGKGKGKAALPHSQNGRIHRVSSFGSMTTRTFREQPPARAASVTGSSSIEITPVPPLPEHHTPHRRTVSLDTFYRAIHPPDRTGQGGGTSPRWSPISPNRSSPRASRALNSLPELERKGSRSSINFSYPTHARPNSPLQSPTKMFVAKSPSPDVGRYPEERPVQNHNVPRTSEITPPALMDAKETQSYRDLLTGDTLCGESEWKSPLSGSAYAIAERETVDSPQEQDIDLTEQPHPTDLSSQLDGADPDRHPSPKLALLKVRTLAQNEDQELQMVEEGTEINHIVVDDPRGCDLDTSTKNAELPKKQALDRSIVGNNGDKGLLSALPAINTSLSPGISTVQYSPSTTPLQNISHDIVSSSVPIPNGERLHSLSPNRITRFSSHLTVPITGEKLHDPPPRSMSHAKSALKHPSSPTSPGGHAINQSKSTRALSDSSDGASTQSDDGRRAEVKNRVPRVSFEDEPEVVGTAATPPISPELHFSASPQWKLGSKYARFIKNGNRLYVNNGDGEDVFDEVMKPRPPLPSFDSVRGRRRFQVEDHDERQLHGFPPPSTLPGSSESGFRGMLNQSQSKHTRPHDTISLTPGDPIPPEVTSVEGTGYDSISEHSSSSDDLTNLDESASQGDDLSGLATVEAQPRPSNPKETQLDTVGNPSQSENVPVISVQLATPAAPTDEKSSNEWGRIPGEFPPSSPPGEDETPDQPMDDTQQRPVNPDSGTSSNTFSIQSVDDDDDDESDDSGESVYSDAAENLAEIEGDVFGSIDAIVDSPISHVSSHSHATPPDSPARSKTDKKRPPELPLQHADPRNSSSSGTVNISSPLPVVKEEASNLTVSSGNTREIEGSNDLRNPESQRMLSPSQEPVWAAFAGTTASSLNSKPAQSRLDHITCNGQHTHTSEESNYVTSKQKGTKLRPPKENPEGPTTYRKQETSTRTPKGPSANKLYVNGHVHPSGVEENWDFGFTSKHHTQAHAYDSDSSSSFKGAKSPPQSTTHYFLRRTMRNTDNRPQSLGRYPAAVGRRSTTPPNQGSSFSSDRNAQMRKTLRDPRSGFHTKASSFSGFGKHSKVKGTATGLSPQAGKKLKSRFGHPSDDEVGLRYSFRSRYDDSSDDEVVPMKFSPVRGIPKLRGKVDGDSTDLDDSSDNEIPQKVLRRPCSQHPSIIRSTPITKPVSASEANADGATTADATNRSTDDVPKGPGGFFSQLPKRQRGIFSRLSISVHKSGGDNRIRKSELDSAARRDTPLERSPMELRRNRSSTTTNHGGDKPPQSGFATGTSERYAEATTEKQTDIQKSSDILESSSWPFRSHHGSNTVPVGASAPPHIPENSKPDQERPYTSDGMAKRNGSINCSASIAGAVTGSTHGSTESSNWASCFRPRMQTRRGTDSTVGQKLPSSSIQSDVSSSVLGSGEKKKKKLLLLRKALGMSK